MLTLHPASPAHMPYRQALLADPATMAYNAPWFPPEGTIPFPEEKWPAWLNRWTGHEPECFCGYLAAEDSTLVGEVCWHGYGAGMGVVIHADHRGKGYGTQGLLLLLHRAFSHPEIARMENTFESTRDPALRMHKRVGFVQAGTDEDGCLVLRLTRERYEEFQHIRLQENAK